MKGYKTVFENGKGKIEKVRAGHFKVTVFTELGHYSFEKRHTTKDDVIYNNLM